MIPQARAGLQPDLHPVLHPALQSALPLALAVPVHIHLHGILCRVLPAAIEHVVPVASHQPMAVQLPTQISKHLY